MWSKINNISAGFTLIEMAVVVALIGLLAGIGVPSFVTYTNIQLMQSTTSAFSTTLQTAKSRAESQLKPTTGSCSSGALSGYEVLVTALSPTKYVLEAICGGTADQISSTTLPSGFTFTNKSNAVFFFGVLQQGIASPSGGITLVQTVTNSSKTIQVSNLGVITVQ